MSFDIFAVVIKDFKSYAGEHSFEFPHSPGIYYITGENNFSKRLGANACGKTSFINAIEWCLYGRTSRGLKAVDIINWDKKSCFVSVTLIVGEEEATITRTQKPNKILLNDKPVTQEDLNLFLRINLEAFNYSVIVPQFGDSFLDLTPTQKLTMFSDIMLLDFWIDKSAKASSKAKKLEYEAHELDTKLANFKGRITSSKQEIKRLRQEQKEYAKYVKTEISKLTKELKEFNAAQHKENKKKTKAKKEVDKAQELVDEVNAYEKELKAKLDKTFKPINNATSDRSFIQSTIRGIDHDIEKWKQVGSVCSTCKQVVDKKHFKTHMDIFLKNKRINTKKIKKLNKEISVLLDGQKQIKNELKEVEQGKQHVYKAKETYNVQLRSVIETLTKIKFEIERIESQIAKLKVVKNPYEKVIDEAKANIEKYLKRIEETKELRSEVLSNFEAYNFWVQGFKRVRLFVIEETLSSLEIEINNNLIQLGLVGWRITFDIERENKSGGISKGFSVMIHSPKREKPIKWESFSGGETQRLKLAANLGLSNLIMTRSGLVSDIEFIDEPSEHLSVEGVEDLIETLQQRAKNESKKIWVIDHRVPDFSEFEGTLTAVMNDKGNTNLLYKGT